MAKKPVFPRIIYVKWEHVCDEEPYLAASETPDGEHGEKIAIYILQTIKTQRVVESLI